MGRSASRRAAGGAVLVAVAVAAWQAVALGGAAGAGRDREASAPVPSLATAAQVGVANKVAPAKVAGYPGPAMVCMAVGVGCTSLTTTTLVPIGRVIDTIHGAVTLDTPLASGKPARTTVSGGVFQLQQASAPGSVLVARLVGGDFAGICGTTAPGTSGAAPPKGAPPAQRSASVVRRLVGDGAGAFRIVGGYADATSADARVRVTDRCSGTTVRVARGKVAVIDRLHRVKKSLRATSTYTAAAPDLQGSPGVSNAAQPARFPGYPGTAKVCSAPGRDCKVLTAQTLVPIGATLDTTKGGISLVTRGSGNTTHRIAVAGALLLLQQDDAPGSILKVRLQGGDFKGICGSGASARAATPGIVRGATPRGTRKVRRVKVKGDGPFEVDNSLANTIARGTAFSVTDVCAGTLVMVTQHKVTVRDVRRHRTKTVRAPGSLLVKAPA